MKTICAALGMAALLTFSASADTLTLPKGHVLDFGDTVDVLDGRQTYFGKQMKNWAEHEAVEKEFKSDYWEKTLCFYSQKRGKYWLTNQRIVFRGGFATILEIPYADIESVQLCNVGGLVQIIPTGIKVTLKSGKSYKLSVTKRKEILAFIQEKI